MQVAHLREQLAHLARARARCRLVSHRRHPLDEPRAEQTAECHQHQAHRAVAADPVAASRGQRGVDHGTIDRIEDDRPSRPSAAAPRRRRSSGRASRGTQSRMHRPPCIPRPGRKRGCRSARAHRDRSRHRPLRVLRPTSGAAEPACVVEKNAGSIEREIAFGAHALDEHGTDHAAPADQSRLRKRRHRLACCTAKSRTIACRTREPPMNDRTARRTSHSARSRLGTDIRRRRARPTRTSRPCPRPTAKSRTRISRAATGSSLVDADHRRGLRLLLRFRFAARVRDFAAARGRGTLRAVARRRRRLPAALVVLTLPWALYTGYFREHQYGMSNHTAGGFLGEWAINVAISTAFLGFVIAGSTGSSRRVRERWVWWATGVTAVFILFVFMVHARVRRAALQRLPAAARGRDARFDPRARASKPKCRWTTCTGSTPRSRPSASARTSRASAARRASRSTTTCCTAPRCRRSAPSWATRWATTGCTTAYGSALVSRSCSAIGYLVINRSSAGSSGATASAGASATSPIPPGCRSRSRSSRS